MGWQEAKYISLYVKSGLAQQDRGIQYYGKIDQVSTTMIEDVECFRFQVSN